MLQCENWLLLQISEVIVFEGDQEAMEERELEEVNQQV